MFLTLETAQYYMAHLVRPLLEQGYFESVTIDRNRLYSQILDNLNKAAVVGFPHTKIGEMMAEQIKIDIGEAYPGPEMLTKQVTQLQENIKSVEFNNVLMKKLKAMKPMITDFLWGQVLKAVGLFFSQMRGEQSVVTKDGEGFKVNGRSVESLSGSTLDVLALAIRCALVKTFIPHTNFLILDEPAAGCDESRTGSVLGFVSTMGFSQTIMASHDPLSESVADNVISLGA